MRGDDELTRRLAALRETYLAESPRRVAELWTAFARVQTGELAAVDDLCGLFHRLAGSGGSYGLMEVTELARAGEQSAYALKTAQRAPTASESDELRARIQKLADAFAAAANPE